MRYFIFAASILVGLASCTDAPRATDPWVTEATTGLLKMADGYDPNFIEPAPRPKD